jgi:hypothetical protein
VPGSSLRNVIDRNARTVPMDVAVWRCSTSFAKATVTDSIGSGWFAEAATVACIDVYFHAARPTPTDTTVTSSRKDPIQLRRFIRDALPNASLRKP